MLLSYKWMDGIGLGSLCGAIIRASLCDANNTALCLCHWVCVYCVPRKSSPLLKCSSMQLGWIVLSNAKSQSRGCFLLLKISYAKKVL